MQSNQTRRTSTAEPSGESSQARYAINYTPGHDHPLVKAAADWLGRSPFRQSDGTTASYADAGRLPISEPRRYGFHATLKAPFRLAERECVDNLERAITEFAAGSWPCPLGQLQVALLRGFLALVPCEETPRFRAFASSIVEAFDPFRAPMNETELRRRMQDHLSDEEAENLVMWGYPYVFDSFRMHFTVTDKIDSSIVPDARMKVQDYFGAHLDEDFSIDSLTLFEQAHPDADFVVRRRFPIGGRQTGKGTPT